MWRIGLAVVLGVSLTLALLTAEAQQARKMYRIGQLSPASELTPMDAVFVRSLRDLGYIEGQNLRFERRHLAGEVISPLRRANWFNLAST